VTTEEDAEWEKTKTSWAAWEKDNAHLLRNKEPLWVYLVLVVAIIVNVILLFVSSWTVLLVAATVFVFMHFFKIEIRRR
jgi:uncharacterized membrane protein